MPSTEREFIQVAKQRLITAEFLERYHFNLDAYYLVGYTIECSLKAAILHLTTTTLLPQTLASITSGAKMHDPAILNQILKRLGKPIPVDLVKKYRRFPWTTSLRYERGNIPTGETRGLLKTATATLKWAEEIIQ